MKLKLNDTFKIRFSNIEWDVDDDGLPETDPCVAPKDYEREFSVSDVLDRNGFLLPDNGDGTWTVDDEVVGEDAFEDFLSDFLSDAFGFCHNGFGYELAGKEAV